MILYRPTNNNCGDYYDPSVGKRTYSVSVGTLIHFNCNKFPREVLLTAFLEYVDTALAGVTR